MGKVYNERLAIEEAVVQIIGWVELFGYRIPFDVRPENLSRSRKERDNNLGV